MLSDSVKNHFTFYEAQIDIIHFMFIVLFIMSNIFLTALSEKSIFSPNNLLLRVILYHNNIYLPTWKYKKKLCYEPQ